MADFHDFEQAGWERAADHYGDAFGSLTSQTIPALLRAAGVGKGTRLLDVASGPGYVAAAAAGLGASVVGVDLSSEMVALAGGRYPGLEFMEGDAEALPFPDRSFAAVELNLFVPCRVRSGNESLRRATAQAMLVKSAGTLTGAVETRNDLTAHIHHLALGIDVQPRARVMHVGRCPSGVEWRVLNLEFWRRLAEVGIFARLDERIIALHRGLQSLAFHRLGLKLVFDLGS